MKKLLCGAVVCLPLLSWAADDRVDIARFSQGDLSGWRPNPFTGNVFMITVESGTRQIGQWVHEKPDRVDAVAIITDTGTTVTTWYRDI